jgi:DNA helicase-2/ATP-dependent DNA helicase PcrA
LTSTATFDFTKQQRSLIETTSSVYVEACPGAGKTQAIVQRFVDRPSLTDPRRGIALLSFTNAAVDEARSRCASAPHLLQVPNFVGTIDTFINRFIVSPVYSMRTGRAPSFRDTWSSVPATNVQVRGIPGTFALDWFGFSLDGAAALISQRIPADRRSHVQSLRPDQLGKVQSAAGKKWHALISRGLLDSATSRLLLSRYLGDEVYRDRLRGVLGARFAEVIVDEVQDCTEGDLLLLELIEEAGPTLVCVGDPDQSIYGFRGSSTTTQNSLLSRLGAGDRLRGNFRSSPAICSVVDSLRHGVETDDVVGEASTVREPVVVASFRRLADVRPLISEILQDRDMPEGDVIVLAHGSTTSRVSAGAGQPMRSTENRLVTLATAIHNFHANSSSPSIRRESLRATQRIVCELGASEKSEAEFLEARGLTTRSFADMCLRIAAALNDPFDAPPSKFKARLSGLLRIHEALGSNLSALRTPKGDAWPGSPGQDRTALRHSTIHGFKGLQHRAVVLVLPKAPTGAQEDGVGQWLSGQPGEPRRVLYVGASRAKELLILATHETRKDDILTRLTNDGVPHVVSSPASR